MATIPVLSGKSDIMRESATEFPGKPREGGLANRPRVLSGRIPPRPGVLSSAIPERIRGARHAYRGVMSCYLLT